MERIIIYDLDGIVVSNIGGNAYEPIGIPFMKIEIPTGKILKNIDVSNDIHVPVFIDIPKNETEILKEQVDSLTIAIANMMGV